MTSEPDYRTFQLMERKSLLATIERLVPVMKGTGARIVRTVLVTNYAASQRYLVVDGWVERPAGGLGSRPKFEDIAETVADGIDTTDIPEAIGALRWLKPRNTA